jgi:hypothetical protein
LKKKEKKKARVWLCLTSMAIGIVGSPLELSVVPSDGCGGNGCSFQEEKVHSASACSKLALGSVGELLQVQ